MSSRLSARVSGSPTMPRRKWLAIATVLCAVFLLGVLPLAAQTCDRSGCGRAACATPATPAPRSLWGELQPTDIGALPLSRDSTAFDEFHEGYSGRPWYTGIDIENGYAITALAYGLQISDLRSSPTNPTVLGTFPFSSFPHWVDSAEEKWPLQAVDAPAGVDNIAAIVGHAGIGIAIVDLTNKSTPHLLYQNYEKNGEEVYAATIGGTQYAFMAASGGNPSGGVYMYNMSQARQFVGCSETGVPGDPVACPGVALGRLGSRNPAAYVHGVDNYVVVSSGSSRGFDIFDLSNPGSPQLKLTGLSSLSVYGVAMWKGSNGHYYLGLRTDGDGRIYDVSCISGSCGGLGSPLWTQAMDTGTSSFFVTYSQGGSSPFLYFGSDDKCAGSTQREWLFDVSSPAAPHDISPATGYWGWYYRGGLTGFNNQMPRRGKFNGSYFYRTALSIFDIHQRTGGFPPVADFSWSPSPAYSGANNPVTFTDLSSGAPTTWTWSFAGTAGPSLSTSAAQNPVVTFASPGTVTVTLTSQNGAGTSTPVIKTVTIASPAPAISGVTISPNPAYLCQPVTFTATGVSGQPTPTLSWVVKKGSNPVTSGGNVPSFTWDTSQAPLPAPGTDYTATVTAVNGAGTASQTSLALTVNALPILPAAGSFTPTYDGAPAPPPSGTVVYHVNVAGATAWNWDFGDGLGFRGYTSDPVLGPNPAAVAYTSVGSKQVRVLIKNCVEQERQSANLSVSITQTTPLLASFSPNLFCQFGQCFATQNLAVSFTDSSTGAQFWDYDWSHTGADAGSCSFTDNAHTSPITSHTFTTLGNFQPCLRVRRGASEQNIQVSQVINVGSASPPSITITGPTAGQVGQVLGFSASASNCNANTGIWSWSMIGGTPNSGSTSAVTVSYAVAGTYAVSVTNSNCAGAAGGVLSVNISGSGGGGGGLAASFVFSPTAPGVGQAVTFDGTASTGTPSQYSWNFGDGSNASGATASHPYTVPGTYSATLTITKPGDGAGCFSGICVSEISKSVVVGGGSLTAAFTVTPAAPNAGQAVTFDASASTGSPTQYSWTFGDGSNATGKIVLHSFASTGTYAVQLTISAPGTGASCSSGICVSQLTQAVAVTAPPLDPTFQTSASCALQFGINQCSAATGASVSLTANTTQATSYAWDFGDGTTGTGTPVNHTWSQPGSYSVKLTVSNAQTSALQTTVFQITGAPPVVISPVLLPWVAQSRGVLVQSSDLYIHNPGTAPIDVTLEFRKRGTPDVNPPRATLTIQPGQTQFNADVLGNLFNRADLTGFISLSVSKGTVQPVVTSFNTVTDADGTKFSQALSGIPMTSTQGRASADATPVPQHLIGLSDNSNRMAVFGITNPGASAATYHLSFFNSQGQAIGNPSDLVVSPYGQRQFQPKEIQTTFGITNTTDYRVKVEAADSSQFFPYDADFRAVSNDPSYFGGAGSGKSAKVYVLGGLSIPDTTGGAWKTDLVLSNITDQPMPVQVTFTRIGLLSTPEHPVSITLKAGETQRLANVIASKWGITNSVGVLTVESDGVSGIYPLVEGESYDTTKTSQFGQVMTAFTDDEAAGAGQTSYLVGLRQNASYKSQLWLFNPSTEGGAYDLIYRGLDGSILGQIKGFVLAPGTTRQVRPIDNPLPAGGVDNGFTVQIVVHTGKLLSGAQVINTVTNDPAYVSGRAQ
jgi:PKD repeat protein